MRLQRLFKKEEISWAALALEVFSVTSSVLVALAIGDWHERRQQQEQVEQALRGIVAECESNRQVLEKRLEYYLALQTAVQRKVEEQGADAPAFPIEGWDGLKPALLRDASYRTAISTQAFSHMDMRVADAVAQVYSLQDLYRFYLDKTVDQMIMSRGFENVGSLRMTMTELIALTQETINVERQLSTALQKKVGSRKT